MKDMKIYHNFMEIYQKKYMIYIIKKWKIILIPKNKKISELKKKISR